MDKEELLKQIAEMEQREKENQKTLEEMRKKVEKLEKEQPTVSATGVFLKEIKGKDYLFLSGTNRIDTGDTCYENQRMLICNAFATKEQAEQESLRREGQEFIRRCAMLWNKGNDWRKKDTLYQCHLYFKPSSDSLCYMYDNNIAKGIPYFDNIALAEKCIAELKKKYNDEQIKTIFGVE